MLFSHIVNLHSGKSAIGQSTFNSLSRMIGMHMHFNDLIVCNQNNGITNRGKEFFKLMLLFLWNSLVQKDNKLCTVAEFNICLSLRRNFCHRRCTALFKNRIVDLFAKEAVHSASQHFQKALSAGIHYSRLFQNRKHFRSSGKSCLCMSKYLLKKRLKLFCLRSDLRCFQSSLFGHSKNGSFLWLHNSLVCCLHCPFHGCGKGQGIQTLCFFYTFCKSS